MNMEYIFLYTSNVLHTCILDTFFKGVFLLAVVVAGESLLHLYIKKKHMLIYAEKVQSKNAAFYYFC